ncbi:MAG: OmpA family protein [Verrucomicrobia bacterium]|jgi:OmpA-OmpF porin, OOP family|nr:OmpA family protein [Verrucomicrobiota bacterium]MBT7700778.1 OmpA family protein [Verrucomicrobiota bacterium]
MNNRLISGVVAVMCMAGVVSAQVESDNQAHWYVSPAIGLLMFEGDQEVENGIQGNIRLGYDLTEWWSIEGMILVAPTLDENFRTEFGTGAEISRLDEANDMAGVHSTSAIGLAVEGLFHFTRWDRLDPFLAIGAGVTLYADDMAEGATEPVFRLGGGVMYHFNDEWGVRADARVLLSGKDTEANSQLDAGLMWTWGARIGPNMRATGGPLDSDGDGLSDVRESELGTDPYDPDTDKDGLSDGDEVLTYKTDPLNPDTDYDGLKDGVEVRDHKTDPLDRDTDDGGVADGHEVIEDRTNPLDPADDLLLIELDLKFDYDKADIKPEYFDDLNVIAKVLNRHEGSEARIEGHADKLKRSSARYNRNLSKRRAQSVLSYLEEVAGIEGDRMESVGYGFDRPKAENDPEFGNPVNRRVEVYLRGVDKVAEAGEGGVLNIEPAAEDVAPEDK